MATTTPIPSSAHGIPTRQPGGAQRPHNAPMTVDAEEQTNSTTPAPRLLDDGCQACNMSKVYCDAIWHTFNRPCCGMCGHP